eukprot:8335452-Alexandrium_andersonii.AAC.1
MVRGRSKHGLRRVLEVPSRVTEGTCELWMVPDGPRRVKDVSRQVTKEGPRRVLDDVSMSKELRGRCAVRLQPGPRWYQE